MTSSAARLLFLLLFAQADATVFSSSLKACQEQCSERNLAFPLPRTEVTWSPDAITACGYQCSVSSCHVGCHDLDEPASKCIDRCSEDGVTFESCIQGCQSVEQAFLVQVQELMSTATVAIDSSDDGFHLKWQFPELQLASLQEIAAIEINWFTQTKALEKPGWQWTALPAGAFRNGTLLAECTVPGAKMNSFSVRLAAVYRKHVVLSRTVIHEVPIIMQSSKLKIISQLQLANQKVAVCWKTTNSDMDSFKVTVASLDGNTLQTHDTRKSCILLKKLTTENCCRVTVLDSKTGSTATVNLKVKHYEDILLNSQTSQTILTFTNGSHILQLLDTVDYALSKEPTSFQLELESEEVATALDTASSSEVFIGTNQGSIYRISLETNETQMIMKPPGDGAVRSLAYDSVRSCIYASQANGLVRCPSETPGDCVSSSYDKLDGKILQLAVDTINGYMYFLTDDNEVHRQGLIEAEMGKEGYFSNHDILSEISPATAIYFDQEEFYLIAAMKNGSIAQINVISNEVILKRTGEYTEINHLGIINDRLFWTRETCSETPVDMASITPACFYSEDGIQPETPDAQPHFGRYILLSNVIDFTFLNDPVSLFSMSAPVGISIVTSDREGIISWKGHKGMPFTAPFNPSKNITYYVTLNASDGDPRVFATQLLNQSIDVIPGIEYTAKVRACFEELCSADVSSTTTAITELKSLPFVFLSKKATETLVLDILGRPISGYDNLRSLDISRPFTYDNTTVTYFTLSSSAMTVVRSPISPDSPIATAPLISYSTVVHLASLPFNAAVYIGTHYELLSYRFTGSYDHTFYACSQPFEECGHISGISVDDPSGEIHFAIRRPNGAFELYEASQEDRTPRILGSVDNFPEVKQILVSNEKVVFITTDNHIGYCDKHLQELNILRDIKAEAIVRIIPGMGSNIGEVPGEVSISVEKKDQLVWESDDKKNVGKTLYKVFMFRDKIDTGERRMEITTENHLTLPPDLLLSWDSAQRFDVRIEAITAWTSFSVNKTSLQAPVKPPSAPTNTNIYATQQKTVDGARAIISFFWEAPEKWNGNPFQYIVNCTKEDGTSQGGTVSSTVTHYSFAVKSGKVSCQVAASNEPNNMGEFSEETSIDSSELKPLVRLFAIDSTNTLMAITDISHDLAARREKRQINQINQMEYQAIAFIGNDLYAVRKEGDSVQPVLVQIDTNDIDNVVHKVSIGGDMTRIEAMTSDWVGNRLLFVSGMSLYQLSLDPFITTSLLNPRKLISLSTGAADAKQLTFDPFKNIAYLLTKNGSLFSLNLWQEAEQNMALAVPCLYSQTVTWMMTEFAWNSPSSPKIYALTWNGLIVVDLEENNKCNEVRIDWNKFGEKGLKAMSAFAIADKLFVFVTSSEMLIYGRETVVPIPIHNPPLRQILAVSQSSQPYPERACFTLPSSAGIQFTVRNEGKTGAFLDVQKPSPPTTCQGVSLPQTHYEVYFTRKNAEKVKHIRSFTDKIHVENGILDKETDYEVTVAWLNRYSEAHGISDTKPFRTGFGYPSAPRDVNVVSVTPDAVYLYWTLPETLNAPINEITYKVTQQVAGLSSPSTVAVQEFTDAGFSTAATGAASCLASPCRIKISNLRPSTDYKFWVTAIHSSHLNAQFIEDADAISLEAASRTKDIAGTLRPDEVTGSSILLRWNSLQAESPPTSISVQYKESGNSMEWKAPVNATFFPNTTTLLVQINNLLSATTYDYRFVAAYVGSYVINGKSYLFREDYYQAVQQVKTKAGVPTAPENVQAKLENEEGWIVSWQEPLSDGGSPITSYAVEMRINRTAEWEIGERGLDGWKLWWRPAKTTKDQTTWEFRVRAANQEGFGPYATTPEMESPPVGEADSSSTIYIVLGVAVISAMFLMIAIFCLVKIRRAAYLARKKQQMDDRNCITLSKLTEPTQYMMNKEKLNEIKNLPRIPEDSIELLSEIGKGSFGNVYRGKVSALPHLGQTNVDVAIKTLRDGYSETDRQNFLTEAIMMNNFDHPNIVRLYGVCLDSRPMYLVLELMSCGDLRNYLRTRSPSETQPSQLTLRDLLSMMVDVGRGCAYLENVSHVHRDIAARNCLVTKDYSGIRITKIADFGFARGVFDSDYYRVCGESFLPLRWLAPESALNGVFSSKSDVWSFGILLTEILSFGEMPYGTLTNQMVLKRLKARKTPLVPPGSPEPIISLMKQCWSFEESNRPSFSQIVDELDNIREQPDFKDDKPFSPIQGYYNEAFDLSQSSNASDRLDSPKEQSSFPMFSASQRSGEQRFDRPERKSSRQSITRSLRKDRSGDDDSFFPSSMSRGSTVDTVSTYDYGSSVASAAPGLRMLESSAYEQPISRSYPDAVDSRLLSRSWAASSPNAKMESGHAQSSRSGGPSRPQRLALPQVAVPSHSYSSNRPSKVSQV